MTTKGIRLPPPISVGYNVVRSLQLEGRIHVPTEGCWPITSVRVAKGWGYPDQADFPGYGTSFLFPPPEPPDLDQKAKKLRIGYYMRVYTAEQCIAMIDALSPVNAAFEITKGWENPPEGRVPVPTAGEEIDGSHSVMIFGVDREKKEFKFDSGWGPKWGEKGMGRLPFSYFQHRLIDAYSHEHRRPDLKVFRGNLRPVMNQFLWGQYIPGEPGSMVHIRELYDASFDEYIGWAIVAERGEWLDVHELFVRPVVRNRGNGRGLMRMLQELTEERKKPLRFWVSFADIDTRSILVKLLRPMGYALKPSPERWAAYMGVRDKASKTFTVPPPPDYIPARPTASTPPSVKELVSSLTVAAALVSGSAFSTPAFGQEVTTSGPSWEYPPSEVELNSAPEALPVVPTAGELKPGTQEFDRKNTRRHELIEKKVDSGLSAEEEAEFQSLQAEILAVTKKKFPRPRIDRELWLSKVKGGRTQSLIRPIDLMVFDYPSSFTPKYAPRGYTRYAAYKDWLRDEFSFRCAYCLTREKWCPTGHRDFAVEHIAPKVSNKHLKTVYENLAYSCHLCNSRKGTRLTLNPRTNPFGTHLSVKSDGTISGLTRDGAKMILLLGLDEDELTENRKHYIEIYEAFQEPANKGHKFVISQYEWAFSYPKALPDLKGKKPPVLKDNKSVNKCCYQRLRGKLKPTVYFK